MMDRFIKTFLPIFLGLVGVLGFGLLLVLLGYEVLTIFTLPKPIIAASLAILVLAYGVAVVVTFFIILED